MRLVSKWVSAIGFSLCAFATSSLAFPPGALAQAPRNYQEAVAAFAQKRATANGVLTDLNIVVGCLGQQEARLQARDKELEGIIGHWATEEKKQAAEVSTQQAAYNGFERTFQAAETDYTAKSSAVENMPGRKEYLHWKRSCDTNDKAFSIYTCSYGRRNMFDKVAQAERELPGALAELESARNTKNAEWNNLRGAQGSLTAARNSLAAATAERHAKEGELTRVRQSTANINDARQPLGIEILEFDNALTEAGKVDLADEHPRTLRKLQAISGKIDGILERSRAAVSQSGSLIPAELHKACRVS